MWLRSRNSTIFIRVIRESVARISLSSLPPAAVHPQLLLQCKILPIMLWSLMNISHSTCMELSRAHSHGYGRQALRGSRTGQTAVPMRLSRSMVPKGGSITKAGILVENARQQAQGCSLPGTDALLSDEKPAAVKSSDKGSVMWLLSMCTATQRDASWAAAGNAGAAPDSAASMAWCLARCRNAACCALRVSDTCGGDRSSSTSSAAVLAMALSLCYREVLLALCRCFHDLGEAH